MQGPFSCSDMAEWYKAGYFTSNLLLKRECDDQFAQLGELTRVFARVPFLPGPPVPPLKVAAFFFLLFSTSNLLSNPCHFAMPFIKEQPCPFFSHGLFSQVHYLVLVSHALHQLVSSPYCSLCPQAIDYPAYTVSYFLQQLIIVSYHILFPALDPCSLPVSYVLR